MLWRAAYAEAAQLAEPGPCGTTAAPCPQQPTTAGPFAAAAGHTGECGSLRLLRQGLPLLAVGRLQASNCSVANSAVAGSTAESLPQSSRSAHLSSARSSHSLCAWREECWQVEMEDGWAEAVEELA